MSNKIIMIHMLFTLLLCQACNNKQNSQATAATTQADTLRQGIAGKVHWVAGNMMPTFDADTANRQPKAIRREVHVYALTKPAQAQLTGRFYTDVETALVKKTSSDDNGEFFVWLPPGEYSLLTKEPEGLYANTYDGEGNIQPVKVTKDSVSHVILKVDYEAVY